MKIALITERYDPGGGGAERSVREMAVELAARGHAVTVLAGSAPAQAGEPSADGGAVAVRVRGQRLRRAGQLGGFARWARRQIEGGGFDASISVTTAVPATLVEPRSGTHRESMRRTAAAAGGGVRRALKAGLSRLQPKKLTALWLEGRTMRDPSVRRFVAVSDYVRRQLVEGYGVDPDRAVVVANASRLPPEAADACTRASWRAALRERLHIGPQQVVYVFAALNPRLKGLDPLLEAMKRAVALGVDGVLLLAGRTQWRHERAVIDLGLRSRVRFLGQTRGMAAVYAAADVTVLPTYFDPASKVVVESLMMGVPAITTAYNGAGELLTAPDGRRRGRIVAEPRDVEGLAQAMLELADRGEREQCRHAMDGLIDELTMGRHVDRLLEVLASVVPGGGAAVGAPRAAG